VKIDTVICRRCKHLMQEHWIDGTFYFCNRYDDECPYELELLMKEQEIE